MEDYSQLCRNIIQDVYGSLLARIFQILSQRGRLSAPQIAQRCRLPLRQIKSALATSIQLRLIYHHTNPDGLSTYQANHKNAYMLLRSGRLIELARDTGGPSAAYILRELTVLGYATVRELKARTCGDDSPGHIEIHSQQVNGDRHDSTTLDSGHMSHSNFENSIAHLIDNGYITKLRDAHFRSTFDAWQEVERQMNNNDGGGSAAKTKKAQIDQDARVLEELEARLIDEVSADNVLRELSANQGSKQSILCANYSSLTYALRNRSLAKAAEKTFGRLTSKVAKAAAMQVDLHLNSVSTPSPNDGPEKPKALDIDQIVEDMRADDAHSLRETKPSTNGWSEDRPINGAHASLNGTHDRSDVIRHLSILAEGPFSFFEYNHIIDTWFVHQRALYAYLRNLELMRLMAEGLSFSDPKLRIVRMLSDKGKLDEKNLQELGLLNAKELRQSLASLHTAGLLELQEVPREPQRQPNRTIFLWFYDAERVRKLYLNKLYKTMSRLFQRLEVERCRLATTLTKIERTDVQGIEEDILSAAELKVLSQWRQREAWFMAEISRIDDSVSILRDLQAA
ncbi:hypothetical protein LTR84_011389 [Exophiala bonariae]|uniref:DNA-directed RNA polymerase III subunit RPC3 n=1 Tax=Exophiala bonariae TaxID=1690606 RepID=A0AAV9MUX3_9EURO|nr:hypothetical protein LTR84_011389 [Exophiala bonariae]